MSAQSPTEIRLAALETLVQSLVRKQDEHDATIAAHTENINELRGDRQRVEARRHEQERGKRGNGPRHQSPVADASAKRQSADAAERERRVNAGLPATIEA